ncbi:MAG TPA: D-2-hydroxyacid dehydrogenase [Methylomirabilota bacterium]|jgi:glyoxylate/hydroxypyruvate reductase A
MAGPAPVSVLVYHPYEAQRYAALIQAPRNRVTVHVASTPGEASRLIGDADVLYAWRFPPALYARGPRLRWLQVMGAGVEWALGPELPASIVVTRAPGVFGPWMAEYVLGWCLWTTQRMPAYLDAQRRRRWMPDILPRRLGGTTMAIVGLGDIGREIARSARALGMRVIGVSRSGRKLPEAHRVYRVSALARVLGEADWVVVVVPLTADTQGLIGEAELAAMRSSAWVINVARGAVVDETALVAALRARRIAGAVLDVFATEPLPSDHPLWNLDNVVVTPHISGPSIPEEIAPVFAENLRRFLGGRPLQNVVDRRRGY